LTLLLIFRAGLHDVGIKYCQDEGQLYEVREFGKQIYEKMLAGTLD